MLVEISTEPSCPFRLQRTLPHWSFDNPFPNHSPCATAVRMDAGNLSTTRKEADKQERMSVSCGTLPYVRLSYLLFRVAVCTYTTAANDAHITWPKIVREKNWQAKLEITSPDGGLFDSPQSLKFARLLNRGSLPKKLNQEAQRKHAISTIPKLNLFFKNLNLMLNNQETVISAAYVMVYELSKRSTYILTSL